jgi:hypothetical protein
MTRLARYIQHPYAEWQEFTDKKSPVTIKVWHLVDTARLCGSPAFDMIPIGERNLCFSCLRLLLEID